MSPSILMETRLGVLVVAAWSTPEQEEEGARVAVRWILFVIRRPGFYLLEESLIRGCTVCMQTLKSLSLKAAGGYDMTSWLLGVIRDPLGIGNSKEADDYLHQMDHSFRCYQLRLDAHLVLRFYSVVFTT